VEVNDSNGRRVTKSGAPIDVDVSDGSGSEIATRISDNHDGTFTVTYQPPEPGRYKIDVVLRHSQLHLFYTHIKDSPFHVNIEAGSDAIKSIAFGPGLEDGVTDQLPTTFTIQARDKNGNDMKKGGDPFDVKINGPNGPVPAKVKDNDDGTYTVDYKPEDAGKHRVDVTLKGVPVAKSPYNVNVKEGADDHTTIIESYSFVIQAKTKKGANRKDGGDDFKVTITGPRGNVPVELKDLHNGTYLVTYRLPDAGEYNISVTLNGKPLQHYSKGIRVGY